MSTKCYFCEDPADDLGQFGCAWPGAAFQIMTVADLELGDKVRKWDDERDSYAVVVRKRTFMSGGGLWSEVWIENKTKTGKTRQRKFCALPDRKIKIWRPGVCGLPMCANHMREVGDGKAYCRDHWGAWERVA